MTHDDKADSLEFSIKYLDPGFVRCDNKFALEYRENGETTYFSGVQGRTIEIPKSLKCLATKSENHKKISKIIDRVRHYLENDDCLFGVQNATLDQFFNPGTHFETKTIAKDDAVRVMAELARCGLRNTDVADVFTLDQLSGNTLFPLLGSNKDIAPTERFFFNWHMHLIFIDGEGFFGKTEVSLYEWRMKRIYPPLPKHLRSRRDHLDGDIQLALASYFMHSFPAIKKIVFHGFF